MPILPTLCITGKLDSPHTWNDGLTNQGNVFKVNVYCIPFVANLAYFTFLKQSDHEVSAVYPPTPFSWKLFLHVQYTFDLMESKLNLTNLASYYIIWLVGGSQSYHNDLKPVFIQNHGNFNHSRCKRYFHDDWCGFSSCKVCLTWGEFDETPMWSITPWYLL